MASWYAWLENQWDRLRSSYWFFPGQMALLAGVVALAAIEFDRREPPVWMSSFSWLTQVSAEGARSVLSTIAGSMMTVTGVVFSITVVALTLASSQFGPRLLRTFLRDRRSQIALGTFVSTFLYSLLVLRAVESPEHVPMVATAGAVVLASASLFVLIFYVHHAASSIQASNVIAAVAHEIEDQLSCLFPSAIGAPPEGEPSARDRARCEELDRSGVVIRATAEGYVRIIDAGAMLELATRDDLLIRLCKRPGSFVTVGAVVARVLSDEELNDESTAKIRDAVVLGDIRTAVQDVEFLIGQLTEMAARALSPGVNDPNTAIACIHRLGGVIARVAERGFPSSFRCDGEDVLRVVAEATDFERLMAACFDSIRRYGAHDPDVVVALLEALESGAGNRFDPKRREILCEHAREIRDEFLGVRKRESKESKRELAMVEARFEGLMRALDAPAPSTAAHAECTG